MSASVGGGSWCTRCDAPYPPGAEVCVECGLVFAEPSVPTGEIEADTQRGLERRQVVLTACTFAVLCLLAYPVAQQLELDGADVAFRVLWLAYTTSPLAGFLLVIVAAVAQLTGRATSVVQVVGTVLVGLALAGTVAVLLFDPGDSGSMAGASRIAASLLLAPGALLAGFAVWLATELPFSAGGSPLDEGSA